MPSHQAQCTLAYRPEKLFDLAVDVKSYPDFLTWWIAAKVTRRDGDVYHTDQVIGFGVFRERFATKTTLQRPGRIDVTSTDRVFQRFDLTWHFDPIAAGGCQVALVVDLELSSFVAQTLFSRTIAGSAGSIIKAFEARAHRLYSATESRAVLHGDGPRLR